MDVFFSDMLAERVKGGRDVHRRRRETNGEVALESLETVFGEGFETIESFFESDVFVMMVIVVPFVPDEDDDAQETGGDSK